MEITKCRPNSSLTLFNILDELFDVNTIQKSYVQPTYDIIENDKEYVINVTLPGFKKESINIDVDNNMLRITAERKEKNDLKYNRRETFFGNYNKQFKLNDNVDEENIEASFTDGILNIIVPKAENKQTKKIEIK